LFLLFFVAAAPSPLYGVYQAQWRFSATTLTFCTVSARAAPDQRASLIFRGRSPARAPTPAVDHHTANLP
jgi:hypothetical protein